MFWFSIGLVIGLALSPALLIFMGRPYSQLMWGKTQNERKP
jgi:hypothetical protein